MEPGTRNLEHVLLVGLSTRAAADSAARAGFHVTALDAFADLDQHPAVRAHALAPLGRRFTASAAARAAATLDGDVVAYLSPFENHPIAVQRMAAGRVLLGNPPDVLRRARDPVEVASTFERAGFAVPRTTRSIQTASGDGRWLIKAIASGGGTRIREWQGDHLPRASYLQERIDGIVGSIAFVAAGGRAVPIGVSRQLTGEPALGTSGCRYCGSIRVAPGDTFSDRTRSIATQLAEYATRVFELVGVNGIDFVVRDGVPLPIEINPRWSASMELAERHDGGAVFAAHARACREGVLPEPPAFAVADGAPAWGKAIVFATAAVTAPDTRPWLTDGWRRDVPRPGAQIGTGEPICTVFAEGANAADCRGALVARAVEIYDAVGMTARPKAQRS